ncbi:MAG TPA: hypothetical protein PLV22_02770, partial [Candidatus Cloacimonadota bacterium]|nr:hypothetical protein [Candidatus Cloacimonadota bacterium]
KDFDQLKAELKDRFGNIPPLALRTLEYYRLRMYSIQIGLSSFQIKANSIVCEYDKKNLPDRAKLMKIVPKIEYPFKFDTTNTEALKLIIDISNANFDKDKKIAYGEKIVQLLAI